MLLEVQKKASGIQFLQDNGLLSDPLDQKEVAMFLRENDMTIYDTT